MAKQVYTGLEAHQQILTGASLACEAIKRTLGPCSGTVLLQRAAGLIPTKDGVTIARELHFDQEHLRLGSRLVADACLAVNEEVGDGTTTTACLVYEMLREGIKLLTAGVDPNTLVAGILHATEVACGSIEELAQPADKKTILRSVAWTASNCDVDIADRLSDALMAIGKNGEIVVEDGQSTKIETEFREGMVLNRGPTSRYQLVRDSRTLEGALVAIIPKVLSSFEDVQSILEEATQFPKNPLLIIADAIEGEALAAIVQNDMKLFLKDNHKLEVVAISKIGTHLHRRGYMEDVAALAGARLVDEVWNHKKFKPEWFGSVRKAVLTRQETVLTAYPDKKPSIDERVARLQLEANATLSDYDREKLQERIGKLTGGICFVRVGGFTESEIKEKKARVEDALGALSAALDQGVVPGGGIAFLTAKEDIEALGFRDGDFGQGQRLLCKALLAPFKTILQNAGIEAAGILLTLQEHRKDDAWIGWDVVEERIRDFGSEPLILDPATVCIAALRAAVSVVTTLLTVNVAITQA
jgi:chaperonin GroEL